jgi:hypothetical protein
MTTEITPTQTARMRAHAVTLSQSATGYPVANEGVCVHGFKAQHY